MCDRHIAFNIEPRACDQSQRRSRGRGAAGGRRCCCLIRLRAIWLLDDALGGDEERLVFGQHGATRKQEVDALGDTGESQRTDDGVGHAQLDRAVRGDDGLQHAHMHAKRSGC
jgi:hypothetical protein